MSRFHVEDAKREVEALFLGLYGPTRSGKTFSALRVATGIARTVGGPIVVIDTENKRASAYADRFKFKRIDFRPPFGPLDYMEALKEAMKIKPGCIVVDSGSHEHEGEGGRLWSSAKELDRLAGDNQDRRYKMQLLSFVKNSGERRQLLNFIMQASTHMIWCFRAQEKIKPVPGKEPEDQGWQPIAGSTFIYQMQAVALLTPGCDGVPAWKPTEKAQRGVIALPEAFREHFMVKRAGQPLSEEDGEFLAKWAAGATPKPRPEDALPAADDPKPKPSKKQELFSLLDRASFKTPAQKTEWALKALEDAARDLQAKPLTDAELDTMIGMAQELIDAQGGKP